MRGPRVLPPTLEHHHSALGIGYRLPRLSWKFATFEDTVPSWVQTEYEICIKLHSSGTTEAYRVKSENSAFVPWPARALLSREIAEVSVRCWGKSTVTATDYDEGSPTGWSEATLAEVGLLDSTDWTASFITSDGRLGPEAPLQPLRFRRKFSLPDSHDGTVAQARLYITSLGLFQAYINGELVNDELMAPGWTSYNHRLNYRVINVTNLIDPTGINIITAEVAEGWYAGRLGVRGGARFWYGRDLALLAQLEVTMNGRSEIWRLHTDDTWDCAQSAIQESEIYNGELYDARLESFDWTRIGNPLPPWKRSRVLARPSSKLVVAEAPPVRVVQEISPVNVFLSKSGKTIIDFGQNLVGKVNLKAVNLPRDRRLVIKHAEVIERGELGTRPLRTAKNTDCFISSGESLAHWTPRFTFHGFRYVEIEGWLEEPQSLMQRATALVMHSDMERRGYFECSNKMVNQLHNNVVWSMKGNFLSVPTDCPQRDERLGWTGDLQVFCPSASFLYNAAGLLRNWLQDLAAEQFEVDRGGIPPLVCPDTLKKDWPNVPQAIWDDVTVLTPFVIYQFTGDRMILSQQYASMKAWLDQGVDRGLDGLWNPDCWQYGDWLDPASPPGNPGDGRTDDTMVADAYLVHTTTTFAQICAILDKHDDAQKYNRMAAELKSTFQNKYISPVGNVMSNTQTGLAVVIRFSLYRDETQLMVLANRLSKLVRRSKFRIATGFAGTPIISHALTKVGLFQLAYRMLLEKKCPSWMYPITMGATTIWERWDSMLPNGSINPGQMTSFNHYALGAVADWLHNTVGGLSPLEPGWKVFQVRPLPGGNLTSAKVSFDGPYGQIESEWHIIENSGQFELSIKVPANSAAIVILPSTPRYWEDEVGSQLKGQTVGSGSYTFTCNINIPPWPPKALISGFSIPEEEDIA